MIIYPLLKPINKHCLVRNNGQEIIFTINNGIPKPETIKELLIYEFNYIINVYSKTYEDRFKDIG